MTNLTPKDRFLNIFTSETAGNRPPVVEEPSNPFEEAVNRWAELAELQDAVKTAMKILNEEEREARDGLAASLGAYFRDRPQGLKEGVNDYKLSNGRKLKFTYGIDRKIAESALATARKAYEEAADAGDPAFDTLLRTKYELNTAPWRKLSIEAASAFSRCLTSKEKAPTLVVD